ncbi:MAG: hypothetical protein K2X87_03200 [Gemmataceae bacterium]|nr:hypothetical protein [Gemmataceae bacterium]
MTTRLGIGLVWVLAGAAAAAAQPPGYGGYPQGGYGTGNPFGGYGFPPGGYGTPGLNPANVMPNIYNPRTQPLSPYLNLTRGGQPAANYYYGVRPGTVGGAGSLGGSPMLAPGGMRGPFFPQSAGASPGGLDPNAPIGGTAQVLPPAGHPVVFGNTLGYFPGSFGQLGRRPGLSGIGATGTGSAGATRR